MKHIFKKILLFFPILLLVFEAFSQSSIYEDRQLRRKFHRTIDYIYGLEFEKSETEIREIEDLLGDHPAVFLLKAFDIYWKKKPFKSGTADFKTFENYLLKTLELSNNLIEENEDDIEAKFFALSAHAYLAQLYVENDENLKALGEAQECYGYITDGFDVVGKYPEYYFPCGIYNYYREKYPEENPFFKPFLWFFRSGDKEEGLEMLKKGADKAIFTKVESLAYLFHIYLRYEYEPRSAHPYARKLYQMYPANMTFVSNYAETLLHEKEYDKAKPLIDTLKTSDSLYDNYVGKILYGMYLEKSSPDADAAIAAYADADRTGDQLEIRNPHFDSYLYNGLGRMYLQQQDLKKAAHFFNLAREHAEYSFVKKEAESYLEKL